MDSSRGFSMDQVDQHGEDEEPLVFPGEQTINPGPEERSSDTEQRAVEQWRADRSAGVQDPEQEWEDPDVTWERVGTVTESEERGADPNYPEQTIFDEGSERWSEEDVIGREFADYFGFGEPTGYETEGVIHVPDQSETPEGILEVRYWWDELSPNRTTFELQPELLDQYLTGDLEYADVFVKTDGENPLEAILRVDVEEYNEGSDEVVRVIDELESLYEEVS
jgi:hypothetical protein